MLTQLRQITALMRNIGEPCEMLAKPALYRLTAINDSSAREMLSYRAVPEVESPSAKAPLLFIHGLEYRHPDDVLRDLVGPFWKYGGGALDRYFEQYDIYFVSWDSAMITEGNHPGLFEAQKSLPSAICVSLAMNYWSRFYRNVERRAQAVSLHLDKVLEPLLLAGAPLPRVITHSFGAYIWSDFIARHAIRGDLPLRLGNWLNLQPAIPWNAYCPGGQFEQVGQVYESGIGRQEIWFSRVDMVLGSVYWLATRQKAMGLVGTRRHAGISHVDMTFVSGEAHGAFNLRPERGCFMRRAGRLLGERMMASI